MDHPLPLRSRRASALLVVLCSSCGATTGEEPDLALPEPSALLPERGRIGIWTAAAGASHASTTPPFRHVLDAQLPSTLEQRSWTQRGWVGACEVLERRDRETPPAARADISAQTAGRIEILRPMRDGGALLLSLGTTDVAGYTASALDEVAWFGGDHLVVRAAGTVDGGIAPFEVAIRQASEVTVMEPPLSTADRASPFPEDPPEQRYRSLRVRGREDMTVRWSGARDDDEVLVMLGGENTLLSGSARPDDAGGRWARCHGIGSELLIPRAVIDAVRRVATAYCTFAVSSRTVATVVTSTGLPIDVVTTTEEAASRLGRALVDFE